MKPSQIIVAKSDAVRADFRRRIEMVHTFNEHRKCADFVLIHNMAWYLVNTMDYYAHSTMADALADCKEALLLFDKEKSDDGDVSAGTLIRVAVTLTKLAEMLLHVKHAHYCRAADAAYDFSQRSFANAQAKTEALIAISRAKQSASFAAESMQFAAEDLHDENLAAQIRIAVAILAQVQDQLRTDINEQQRGAGLSDIGQ